ncbi:hypothetical protein ACLB2K_006016 [Fragaria x ananassa]
MGCIGLSADQHASTHGSFLLPIFNYDPTLGLRESKEASRDDELDISSNLCSFRMYKPPRVSSDNGNTSELYLDGTAFGYLPEQLRGLILLSLKGCKNLQKLPLSICSMTSLKFLYLSSCSSIQTLPEDIGHMEYLEELDMCETAIREVPESISSLKNLKLLCFHGCAELRMPYILPGLISLRTLNLGGCNFAEGDITDETGIGTLISLQSLDLSENNFSSIPESISKLPELREISLRGCDSLELLLGDPPASAKNVDIRGCTMLTNCSDERLRLASDEGLRIRNCRKWDYRRPLMSLSVQFDEFHETPYP